MTQEVNKRMKVASSSAQKFVDFVNAPFFDGMLKRAEHDPQGDDAREIMTTIYPDISATSAKLPFSQQHRKALITKLYAMIQFFDLPSFYWSFAPHDIDSHMIMKICSEGEVLEIPQYSVRAEKVAKNPVAAARFFNRIVHAFLETLICLPDASETKISTEPRERVQGTRIRGDCEIRILPLRNLCCCAFNCSSVGIFGRPIAHFTVSEAQGRGTLHCHGLGWTDGITPALLQKVAADADLSKYLASVLDSYVSGEVPQEYHDKAKEERQKKKDESGAYFSSYITYLSTRSRSQSLAFIACMGSFANTF